MRYVTDPEQPTEVARDITIVTLPIYPPSSEPYMLRNLLRVFKATNYRVNVICGGCDLISGKNYVIDVGRSRFAFSGSLPMKTLRLLRDQLVVANQVLRMANRTRIFVFHIGEFRSILPLLVSKIVRRKAILYHIGGNKILETWIETRGVAARWTKIALISFLIRFSYKLADAVVSDSNSNARFAGLDKFRNKLFIAPYVNIDRYLNATSRENRDDLIGFVGRLVPKKEVLNFVLSIPMVLEQISSSRFVIIGEGPLSEKVLTLIKELGISSRVTLIRKVTDDDLKEWYSRMKILVLPSIEEGMPAVVLEAMACGTIVVATPVGGLPDIIIDGVSGFLISGHEPSSIAEGVLRAFRADLVGLQVAARQQVQNAFSIDEEKVKLESMLDSLWR